MKKRILFGALLCALTLFSMQAQDTLSVSKSRKLQFGIDIHYNAALSGHDKYGSLCDDELSDELAFHLSLLYPFHPHFAVGVGTGVECLVPFAVVGHRVGMVSRVIHSELFP